jgi:hypothetical protein
MSTSPPGESFAGRAFAFTIAPHMAFLRFAGMIRTRRAETEWDNVVRS